MRGLHWGSTPEEVSAAMVGDELCADARLVATRSITIDATPSEVFPWLRQMGFKRAGWYSYDVIDNLGRKSATTIHPEWQDVNSGDFIPGGPIAFEAVVVDYPRAFVLRYVSEGKSNRGMCFTLAYELHEDSGRTRLVTRVRARINYPGGKFIERFVLGPGDGFMLRRQLKGIARRAGH